MGQIIEFLAINELKSYKGNILISSLHLHLKKRLRKGQHIFYSVSQTKNFLSHQMWHLEI